VAPNIESNLVSREHTRTLNYLDSVRIQFHLGNRREHFVGRTFTSSAVSGPIRKRVTFKSHGVVYRFSFYGRASRHTANDSRSSAFLPRHIDFNLLRASMDAKFNLPLVRWF
jgi:hypothetical protein